MIPEEKRKNFKEQKRDNLIVLNKAKMPVVRIAPFQKQIKFVCIFAAILLSTFSI